MEFFLHESCGQCTPCREGNFRLLHAVREISAGRLTREQSAPYYELASVMKSSSKCGLGLTSANCFTDIIDRFVFTPGKSDRKTRE
jgi:[NiFe] hydrogenase diaphorase moiety large subunit